MKIYFLECIMLLAIAFALGMVIVSAQTIPPPDRYIDTIVVHHSGARNIDVSADQIRVYHINERGWSDIGYHYVIRRTGVIENGRALSKAGAHKKNHNKGSIGICLSGNTATKRQLRTLKKLCKRLKVACPNIDRIERHHESCPGPSVDVEKLNKEVIK